MKLQERLIECQDMIGRYTLSPESYDQAGNVNRVRPKMIDGQDVVAQHYPPTKVEIESWTKKLGAPK